MSKKRKNKKTQRFPDEDSAGTITYRPPILRVFQAVVVLSYAWRLFALPLFWGSVMFQTAVAVLGLRYFSSSLQMNASRFPIEKAFIAVVVLPIWCCLLFLPLYYFPSPAFMFIAVLFGLALYALARPEPGMPVVAAFLLVAFLVIGWSASEGTIRPVWQIRNLNPSAVSAIEFEPIRTADDDRGPGPLVPVRIDQPEQIAQFCALLARSYPFASARQHMSDMYQVHIVSASSAPDIVLTVGLGVVAYPTACWVQVGEEGMGTATSLQNREMAGFLVDEVGLHMVVDSDTAEPSTVHGLFSLIFVAFWAFAWLVEKAAPREKAS